MISSALKSSIIRTGASVQLARFSSSLWSGVQMGPPDPILGINEAFMKDKDSKKVNLSIGAYRDNDGKPWILPSVKEAQRRILEENYNHEYLPISGNPVLVQKGAELLFGEDFQGLKEERVAGAQALSGTGSLRLSMEFIKRFYPQKDVKIYAPLPTWPTHHGIAKAAHIQTDSYDYYDPEVKLVNPEWMINDISKVPEGSIVILHACAHNPTGADPSPADWDQLKDIFLKRNLFALFDSAYQGFASGDLERDAYAIRLFAKAGVELLVCQSFAKNLGLYGQRTGTVQIIAKSKEERDRINSQLKIIARTLWSNPPKYGARIAEIVLSDPSLRKMWYDELKVMSGRIADMRSGLEKELKNAGSTHNWTHISKQIGMFAFTGLKSEHVKELMEKHHIFLTMNGRISMAGLNEHNLKYVAQSFHEVTKDSKI